jgi:phage pi2 protein 07
LAFQNVEETKILCIVDYVVYQHAKEKQFDLWFCQAVMISAFLEHE